MKRNYLRVQRMSGYVLVDRILETRGIHCEFSHINRAPHSVTHTGTLWIVVNNDL